MYSFYLSMGDNISFVSFLQAESFATSTVIFIN